MMQREHVQVAAQHTLSILRWAPSREAIDEEELHYAFDAIYQYSDFRSQHSLRNGSYDAWKAITFEGVKLAYANFFGQIPDASAIRKFLMEAGDNEDWGVIPIESRRPV